MHDEHTSRTTSRMANGVDRHTDASPTTNTQLKSTAANSQSTSHVSIQSLESDTIRDIKCDVLANWLHMKSEEKMWVAGQSWESVFVKKRKGSYAHYPVELVGDGINLYTAIATLNVHVLIRELNALPHCQKNQSAAFIASHETLVVWEDDPVRLLNRAQGIQDSLVKMIWGSELSQSEEASHGENIAFDVSKLDPAPDQGDRRESPRRIILWQATYTSVAVCMLIAAIGSGYRKIAIQQLHEPNWFRLFFIAALPGQVWLSLFFFQAIVGNIAQVCGSLNAMRHNSMYYSAKSPRCLERDRLGGLPHVTIQMPVYKEGLQSVIKPTVQSIKQAISTYELQGGSANIFVNDDGMQLLSKGDAQERKEFYEEHNIGWVARPKHNPNPKEGEKVFFRRGKFKKASNMNYALHLSDEVEERLAVVERGTHWSQKDEDAAYAVALKQALEARKGETWAEDNIRIGDYILIIDSDTRVPEDCLLEAVSEMEQCPEVAILQYISGVMNVTNTFFENGITFFTNMIYTMIKFAVANGDVAPFVGHNAILRWSALQTISYNCESDHCTKFWSESTVSEDFDMSLRLQAEGYIVRLAAYKGDGFKEGVSLTVYDELARWEKYAFGCNELIFNPLKDWLLKGPFTRLFISFFISNMPLASKITIMAYIGTYYAIGSSWIFTVLNYFLVGFFNGHLDHYYIDSFRVYFAIIFIFTVVGNISLAVVRARISEANVVNSALVSHFLSVDMEWGSTSKEASDMTFFEAISDVGKNFKWTFAFCGIMTGVMLVCAFAIQEDWQIRLLVACWPTGTVVITHALLPIVLNPDLITFTW
ncbi:glycosyl transferase family group 2-domain-containing protein [Phaeosphaeriaceae sp. PMI808]|nr:glycosyl transferase family group 2-domain-containing protein [Phaeosphaeriaceae sp. PMI808]